MVSLQPPHFVQSPPGIARPRVLDSRRGSYFRLSNTAMVLFGVDLTSSHGQGGHLIRPCLSQDAGTGIRRGSRGKYVIT